MVSPRKIAPPLISFLLLVSLLISLIGCGYEGPPYQHREFIVAPVSAKTMIIDMNPGSIFEGFVDVEGGNDDIRFYVKDSHDNIVLDKNRVSEHYNFHYQAELRGSYTVYFDNSFSLVTDKKVTIYYRVR